MIHLNIGSNLGDRAAYIGRAVAAVEARFGVEARVSAPVESEAWGYESANTYLNLGVALPTAPVMARVGGDPERLLDELLSIERAIDPAPHRHADGTYADRRIDIDLIAVDTLRHRSATLTLPHPRLALRPFVLGPLEQLEPGLAAFLTQNA